MQSQSLAERIAIGITCVAVFGMLLLGIEGVRVPLPWDAGPRPAAAVSGSTIKLPYDAAVKDTTHLLPCCNVAAALELLNVSQPARQEQLRGSYLSELPLIEKGAVVSVRAFYALRGDAVGQPILLFPTPERLTSGTAALVETADGGTGYVAAPLVFPP